MCLCEPDFPKETAFVFLEDLMENFYEKFSSGDIDRESAYSKFFAEGFNSVLRDKMMYYNKNPEVSNDITELKKGILSYKENIIKAQDVLIERGEKISLIVKKADSLKTESTAYFSSAKKVRRAARCRKIMLIVFSIIAVLLIAYFISAMICGWTWSSCRSSSSRLRFLGEDEQFDFLKKKDETFSINNFNFS